MKPFVRRVAVSGGLALLLSASGSADQIPELNSKGTVYKSEGPTDHTMYPKALGAIKAVMIFVDFPDAPADGRPTAPVADHLLGGGKAQQFFHEQSYGKMTLDVTIINGWKRMSKPARDYVNDRGLFSFAQHSVYLTEACALSPAVKFSAYPIVYVVAADTPAIRLSPGFNARPGAGAKTADGEVRLAVTFGHDSYRNRYTNLIHETAHLLGLPDLYNYNGSLSTGAWDIMCDIFKGTSLLGWHRHKLGWLDSSRKGYLNSGHLKTTLTPLSAANGVSMIVTPADDPEHPTTVFVVELAQPILGTDGTLWGDGVLIYSVNAAIPTGKDPVVIYPKQPGASKVYGNLYQAPFGVGDTFQAADAPMTVKVEQKKDTGYVVTVHRRGQATF